MTFTYGVRWDYFPMGTRKSRGMERYNFDSNQMSICGAGGVPTNCGYDIGRKNFSPRLGIAYRPSDTWVVRAGYGINYDPYPLAFVRDPLTNYPVVLSLSVNAPNTNAPARLLREGNPTITPPDISKGIIPVPAAYAVRSLPQNVRTPYIQSWNFTLQKQLGMGLVAQAGYVGTRQIRITQRFDLNAAQVGGGAASQLFNQRFGGTAATELLTPIGHNDYDSLQTTLQRRFANGLQINVAYTWSKIIGICCDDLSDGPPQIQALPYFKLNRAVMPYHRPHNFNASFIYELPFGRSKRWANGGGLVSALAGGWQINGLFASYSGSPFTVTASGASLNASPGNNQRADLVKPHVEILGGAGPNQSYFDPLAFAPVTAVRFGTSGFNSVRGPGVVNLDFSLFRDFRITERVRAHFRAEAFNFTNTPHFSNPNGNVSNLQLNGDGSIRNLGGYTVITTTSGIGREGIDERVFRFGLRIRF